MSVRSFIRKHLRRGFKFAMVGSLGAVESLILQYFLTEFLGIHYMLSAVLGIGLAMFNNYFLNYYFTFKLDDYSQESRLFKLHKEQHEEKVEE